MIIMEVKHPKVPTGVWGLCEDLLMVDDTPTAVGFEKLASTSRDVCG